MILQTTLSAAAAAAVINFWLAMRIGQIRMKAKISHGDGGDVLLARRIRAQLNFVENTPFILALIAAIELSGKGGLWLSIVAAIYMLGRIGHGFGMDADGENKGRMIGTIVTFLTLIGLAIYAVLAATGVV